MKNLRSRWNRFCLRHRDKGIPNLMLYLSLGSALVYLMSTMTGNYLLYDWLCFDRELILQGQIWRLISYPLTYSGGNLILTAITLFCYYSLGRAMENIWGTFRFNLFYATGVVLMDIFCMLVPYVEANVMSLNLSLFLAYATMFPDAQFLLFFIIPVKAWIFALFYLAITAFEVFSMVSVVASYGWPMELWVVPLFPVISLANYFLFFGRDIANVFPSSWRINARRAVQKKPKGPKVVPFPKAGSYEASATPVKAPYTHRCTVCGRTDTEHPELEFRYCSRCKGYFCYCIDHINNHTHVE
jgi:membrane associated rhomboid family serine protease